MDPLPPCTLFSNLQELNKYVHGDDPEWIKAFGEEKRKAAQHVEFCVALYRHQLRHGLHLIHEHLWGANYCKFECVQELLADGSVSLVEIIHAPVWHELSYPRERWRQGSCEKTHGLYDEL